MGVSLWDKVHTLSCLMGLAQVKWILQTGVLYKQAFPRPHEHSWAKWYQPYYIHLSQSYMCNVSNRHFAVSRNEPYLLSSLSCDSKPMALRSDIIKLHVLQCRLSSCKYQCWQYMSNFFGFILGSVGGWPGWVSKLWHCLFVTTISLLSLIVNTLQFSLFTDSLLCWIQDTFMGYHKPFSFKIMVVFVHGLSQNSSHNKTLTIWASFTQMLCLHLDLLTTVVVTWVDLISTYIQ